MKTLAVMCMALQSTSPSCTPLFLTISSTCGVMFTKSIRAGTLNVRYSVCDFMAEESVKAGAASGGYRPRIWDGLARS